MTRENKSDMTEKIEIKDELYLLQEELIWVKSRTREISRAINEIKILTGITDLKFEKEDLINTPIITLELSSKDESKAKVEEIVPPIIS